MFLRYKITYGLAPETTGEDPLFRRQCLLAACLLMFIIGAKFLWPEGTAVLQEYLMPNEEVNCILGALFP